MISFITDVLRSVQTSQLAALIPKNIDQFPENKEKMSGTIDVWWIVRILLQSVSENRFSQMKKFVMISNYNDAA